jgi:sulfite reductase subunit B
MKERLKKLVKMDWLKQKKENPHLPDLAKIEKISQETDTIKTFTVKFLKRKLRENFVFIPGQFIQVSVFGVGEAPISFSCSPIGKKHFEFSVRNVGSVTNALFELKKGNTIGIRGPFGNGYPIKKIMNKNVIMVAGGIGFPPLKSLIEYMLETRKDFGHMWLLYGAKDPSDIVFKKTLSRWGRRKNFDVLITVDKPDKKWKGNVGVVTSLFDKVKIPSDNLVGITCGPPVMMKYVVKSFKKIGLKNHQIFLSMERLMQCGIGKCGHCNIGNKYVCKDGPVFSYEELRGLTEKW